MGGLNDEQEGQGKREETAGQGTKKGSSVKCIDRKKYFYYDKNKAGIIYLCSDQTQ